MRVTLWGIIIILDFHRDLYLVYIIGILMTLTFYICCIRIINNPHKSGLMTLQVLYDTLYLRLSMGLALVIIHLNGDFPMDFPEPKTTQLWGYPRHGNLEAFLELGCPEP